MRLRSALPWMLLEIACCGSWAGGRNPEIAVGAATALQLRDAAGTTGCAYLRHPLFPAERCRSAIECARRFFRFEQAVKDEIDISRSPHFRGYSQMRNQRDWREQIHFGREEHPRAGGDRHRLQGPNLWPPDPRWRRELLQLMADLERAGMDVLAAMNIPLPAAQPYLLLKLIHYECPPGGVPRSGVAPHVDFSWLTLLVQDDTGGLDIRTPDGEWVEVTPRPGTLVLNIGELIEYASGAEYRATPHRVTNRSLQRSRVSLPFFLNPGLDTMVTPRRGPDHASEAEHVHRVYSSAPGDAFVFGDAEWRRKGLGLWCYRCARQR